MLNNNFTFSGMLIDNLIAVVEKVERTACSSGNEAYKTRVPVRENVTRVFEFASRPKPMHEVHEVA